MVLQGNDNIVACAANISHYVKIRFNAPESNLQFPSEILLTASSNRFLIQTTVAFVSPSILKHFSSVLHFFSHFSVRSGERGQVRLCHSLWYNSLSTIAVCFSRSLNTWITARRLLLWKTSRLIQWCHFASPTQLTHIKMNMPTDMFTLRCSHSNDHTLHNHQRHLHHLRTILFWVFSVATHLLARHYLFSLPPLHQRNRFLFSVFFLLFVSPK